MPAADPVPEGFTPVEAPGPFMEHAGPVHERGDGVLGVRAQPHHANGAGTVMGGFLATLVDAALGRAIRAGADGETAATTVSLTVDFLRAGPIGAWLEAHTELERLGGSLAFADCSVRADGEEIVRARAVFAVREAG
jgi:acyl-coenzyme A thioesterase 13